VVLDYFKGFIAGSHDGLSFKKREKRKKRKKRKKAKK
jgi:hypothetical protein